MSAEQPKNQDEAAIAERLADFLSYMPSHNYIYTPTGELWPASSLNGRFSKIWVDGVEMRVTDFLDKRRAVEQMVWDPSEPWLISNRVMRDSGYVWQQGAKVFNLYRGPSVMLGESSRAGPWVDHVKKLFPDEFNHILDYLAFKVQNPGIKINHALVLGGAQGIGKDTILEPVKQAIGPWNWHEVSPTQMVGRFNGWVKSVMLRISEARDMGESERMAFYEMAKPYLASPPDVVRVDEKNLREYYVANVCGVIITTNHKSDGLYLPADDRRHFVAWSELRREDLPDLYFKQLHSWFENYGVEHVVAYLHNRDVSSFNPKAPPPKTPAFWEMVQSNESPESGELRALIASLNSPTAVTMETLKSAALEAVMMELHDELANRRNKRSWGAKLASAGYVRVHNPDAADGLFSINGSRVAVYADRRVPKPEQIKAARALI